MALCIPIYDPGDAITGTATGAAIVGSRFVSVAATKTDGNPTPIKHCLAAEWPIGVSADDCPQNSSVAVYGPGFVAPVLVGGAGVTAGHAVEILDTGTVQDLASGHKCGVSLTTTAPAGYALVRISI